MVLHPPKSAMFMKWFSETRACRRCYFAVDKVVVPKLSTIGRQTSENIQDSARGILDYSKNFNL
ncbi:hypothetical protein DAI22_06g113600 [Oryza sativa Japonica Group]|nr:hypothetical protein DAI22_06g113600 [Oryza sativa Japonica Group]